MPACHGICKTLTKFIHEARAAAQPATGVAHAINTATSTNKVFQNVFQIYSFLTNCLFKGGHRSTRNFRPKAIKSAPVVETSDDEGDNDEVIILDGDITMGDASTSIESGTDQVCF